MTFPQRKLLVLSTWALTVATLGLILAIDKPDMWMLIAIMVIIPVVVSNWLWNAPEPTLSEIIAKTRSRSNR